MSYNKDDFTNKNNMARPNRFGGIRKNLLFDPYVWTDQKSPFKFYAVYPKEHSSLVPIGRVVSEKLLKN